MIALIIGGSSAVIKDVRTALDLCRPDITIAVNDIGIDYLGPMHHWVTLHPARWQELLSRRQMRNPNRPLDFKRWSPPDVEDVDKDRFEPLLTIFPDYKPSGLSGLYAVKVALHCGADKIVLAGVPMDLSGHFLGNRHKHWINLRRRKAWEVRVPELVECVRSVSGWTRELLGAPTREWFAMEAKAWPRNQSHAQP